MSRRVWTILALSFAVFLLAYALREPIEQKVIRPLAYVGYMLGLYYSSFPQVVIWIVLIVVAALLAVGSLAAGVSPRKRGTEKPLPVQGPVESLAVWIAKSQRGTYFKWLIAQRLGVLSREMLAFNARQAARTGKEALSGPGWDPPEEVAAYLESGLNGSFADFPRPRWPFQNPEPTPLDVDPVQVMDYIESQIEKT